MIVKKAILKYDVNWKSSGLEDYLYNCDLCHGIALMRPTPCRNYVKPAVRVPAALGVAIRGLSIERCMEG